MSIKNLNFSYVVVSVSHFTAKRDLLHNEVIEAVARIFFPTAENLRATLTAIKKETPSAQLKLYREYNVTNWATAAKKALFSIGCDTVRQLIGEEMAPVETDISSASTADSTSFSEETVELFPVIYAVSELIEKRDFFNHPLIESTLQVIAPTMDNLIETEQLMIQLNGKWEMQTHLRCHRDNILTVAESLIAAEQEQKRKARGVPINELSSSKEELPSRKEQPVSYLKGGVNSVDSALQGGNQAKVSVQPTFAASVPSFHISLVDNYYS